MQDHYFSKNPKSELKLGMLQITNLRGHNLEVYTASGIFSVKKVDRGTWTLIENMKIYGKEILDFGCGIGLVGIIYSLEKPNSKVTFLDINQRAIKITKMNIKKLGIKNTKTLQSDLFGKVNGKFDNILSNPPISAGMETCYKIIEQSFEYLNENGILQIVARHKKGGARIMKKMQETFKNCQILAKNGGFWVYASKKETTN